jgi:membrane protease YdiL (CAAX protease family)
MCIYIMQAHHLSTQTMIPLMTLGFVWAMLYVLSGNLLVTVLIHSMWNSRVFLGSLLGI